ncbi:hypothetical protein LOZ12_002477 [Ophidiomyces ophidiicola]|uniref:Uncharacterized protein n=1 Tax=Ophidiomyces ophidiicola TaxID=1387563 RepID=A0ACB8V1U1_9EURO|nr:hypothetical protein LOZ62_001774 [Ophidiomyces ophidiicola]KAI1973020.1 hypothetical protein LOZ56_002065 [Ophidiomyces ophidiicola]KAI2006832.1 hypothetical protein LOZ50_002874 [Ophidiomyces ophidiicola]KAI2025611.1 hypothetical protein LOZ46_000542 [Ophidiomyces ophidiicola]KAI2026692.1 hypothetical protein LOZ45_002919 [Ophidiomyces ophidiicola]
MSFQLPPASSVYLLLGSLPLLVLAEARAIRAGHALFKILSSIAFVSGPLRHFSAESSSYHTLITCGLVCSLVGDILLIPSKREYYPPERPQTPANSKDQPPENQISVSFQLGVVAFAAAHISYILAFVRDAPKAMAWPTFLAIFAATMVISKWLGVIYPSTSPSSARLTSGNLLSLSIPSDMRPLVAIYATIISSMLAIAISTTPSLQHQRVLGAVMFVLSDIFVAKDAFGKTKKQNAGGMSDDWLPRGIGWVLYFWGQMVLAGTAERK